MKNKVLEAMLSAFLWFCSVGCFILLGPVYIFASLFVSAKRLHPFARWACRLFLRAAGQTLDVRDAFPSVQSGPYIYMFNHTSLLDTFIAIAILPEFTGAIGKKEQFRIPIWGHLLRRWGTIPIERGKLQNAIQSLNKAETIMNAGNSLLIAPEGTRSKDGHLQPFKKGPFHIAIKTQTPIVLIGITGAFQSKRKGSWLLRPGTITVRIPPPIPTKGHTVLSLREEAQRIMCSLVV